MNRRRITIRKRLLISAIGVLVLLGGNAFITFFYIRKNIADTELLGEIKDLASGVINMQKTENDFLLHETINPSFFETGISEEKEDFMHVYNRNKTICNRIVSNHTIKSNQLVEEFDTLNQIFDDYRIGFERLVSSVKQKGFQDYGVIGEMRDQIHNVEHKVQLNNDLLATKYMLMLRRHEKDYLIRKQIKYQQKFDDQIDEFIGYLNTTSIQNQILKNDLINELKEYQRLFAKVISFDNIIGLSNDYGLLNELHTYGQLAESKITGLHEEIVSISKASVKRSLVILFSGMLVFSVAIMLILVRISNEIVHSLKKLNNHVKKLGIGKLPEKLTIKYNNEISDMICNINVLTENLNNTRNFAIEVGKGNLDTDINVFNNSGDIGGSLIEMRRQLKKVAEERKMVQQEEYQQSFINEGLAKTNDIIRRIDAIEELCLEILVCSIKHINANQGTMFIKGMEDCQQGDCEYEAIAAYAYDRRKYTEKKIRPGEGIAGAAILERDYIYMTDLPEDYISITSGLGEARPRALLVVPLIFDDNVVGVIELAGFKAFQPYEIDYVKRIAQNFAQHIQTSWVRLRTEKLLIETREQKEHLMTQEEELRQNLEEMQATQDAMNHKEEELNRKIFALNNQLESFKKKIYESEIPVNGNIDEIPAVLKSINNHVVLAELDSSGRFVRANKELYKVLECEESFLKDKFIFELLYKEGLKVFDNAWDKLNVGKTITFIEKLKNKKLQPAWLKMSFAPFMDTKSNKLNRVILVGHSLNDFDSNFEASDLAGNIKRFSEDIEINAQKIRQDWMN